MASQQPTTSAHLAETNLAPEPNTFYFFRKLAPELRDMIWKFTAPGKLGDSERILTPRRQQANLGLIGPRIVSVKAGNSLRCRSRYTIKSAREHTLKVVEKYEFKMGFVSNQDDPGMLRACKESRHIMVKMLPIRLPSRDPAQEIRLGPHEVLWITDPVDFFYDLSMALKHELKIPSAIRQIPALCFRANSPQRTRAQGLSNITCLMQTILSRTTFRQALLALKSLQSVVFCLSSEPQLYPDDCFSDYTTDFDPTSLKKRRSRLLHFANTHAEILKSEMKTWQDSEKDKYPNLPEVRIMAKGWPVKKLPAEKRVKKLRLQGAGSGMTTSN